MPLPAPVSGRGAGVAWCREGATELVQRFRSHSVQLHDLGLADLGELFEPYVPGRRERPSGRYTQPGRKVVLRLIAPRASPDSSQVPTILSRLLRSGFTPGGRPSVGVASHDGLSFAAT